MYRTMIGFRYALESACFTAMHLARRRPAAALQARRQKLSET
jgi:hypothetical protein